MDYRFAKVVIVIGLGLTPMSRAFGQNQKQAVKFEALKIDDLISQALAQNQELKAQELEVQSQKAQVGPAGAPDDPMLDVKAMNFPADTLSSNQEDMTGVEVSVSQSIPFPGKRGKLREAQRHSAIASQNLFEQKKWQLIKQVKDIYYTLYLAYQNQALLEEQKRILGQVIATSRSQYTLGKVSQAALLNLQAEEAGLIDELLKSESAVRVANNELNHLLGHTGAHQHGRSETIQRSTFDFKNWTEDKIAALVVDTNARLKGLESRVQSEAAKLGYAKKGYLPDFRIMAGYTFREPTRMGGAGTDMVSAGIGISIPLWAGSKQSEQIKSAAAERAKAEAEYRDGRLMTEHEARGAFAELTEAQKRIDLFKGGLLQLTAQAVASGRSAYLTGKIDFAGLLDAIRTQYKTQYAYQEALAKFEMKLAHLEALASQSLTAGTKGGK